MKIGCQLYSLREHAKTPEELRQTLRAVKEMGYRYVQLSGICKCDPIELREMLDENGLAAVVCHASFAELSEELGETLAYYDTVGCPEIGIGGMPPEFRTGPDGTKAFMKAMEPALQALAERGKKLYYHNHAFDLKGYRRGEDNLTILSADDRISLLLDTYWIHAGGLNAHEYIRSKAGKCDIIHFKDWETDGNTPRYAPVGRGNLDWKEIYAACKDIGVRYAFVEQDKVYDDDTPLACAAESFQNMKGFGWVK